MPEHGDSKNQGALDNVGHQHFSGYASVTQTWYFDQASIPRLR